jgi:hypothetical protein
MSNTNLTETPVAEKNDKSTKIINTRPESEQVTFHGLHGWYRHIFEKYAWVLISGDDARQKEYIRQIVQFIDKANNTKLNFTSSGCDLVHDINIMIAKVKKLQGLISFPQNTSMDSLPDLQTQPNMRTDSANDVTGVIQGMMGGKGRKRTSKKAASKKSKRSAKRPSKKGSKKSKKSKRSAKRPSKKVSKKRKVSRKSKRQTKMAQW